jgi:hypothetical protein
MRMNPRQDTLLLSNDDLGVGVVFSGMQGYAGNATTCLEDHEDAVRTVQYPDHDIVSLATGFAKPLRKASVTEAWVLYQVLDFSERSTERKNALVGITLCRTLEPDQSVIAIQTSLFWSEWETDLPPILDVMNSVEFPESAPEYRAFTVPTPNVILRDET